MAKLGKRTTAARASFAGKSNLSVKEAVTLLKNNANAKFDETVDISINLGVDPRHADQMVLGQLTYRMALEKQFELACLRGAQRLMRLRLREQMS